MNRALFLFKTALFAVVFITGCTPRPAVRTVVAADRSVVAQSVPAGDTCTYAFSFPDKARRTAFINDLEAFTADQRYASRTASLSGHYVRVDLLPVSAVSATPDAPRSAPEPPAPTVVPATPLAVAEQGVPLPERVAGGRATLYSSRGFIDDAFLSAVSVMPFVARSAGTSAPLIASAVSERRITLTLGDSLRTPEGKKISALDLVVAWNSYVREHPAEGYALFRHVKGIEAFIKGNEAVISGITAASPVSIVLNLAQNDPRAMERLASFRLLPPVLGLGPYQRKGSTDRTTEFARNAGLLQNRASLEAISLIAGGDKNPFLAFSMGKYNGVVLTARKDVEYAKRSLYAQSQLVDFESDQYFLALNITDTVTRMTVRSAVNSRDILMNAVRADGDLPGDSELVLPGSASVSSQIGSGQRPLTLLYRTDDPVSVLIAERLFADFKRAGIGCELKGKAGTDYQRTLVGRDYSVALGWVTRRALSDNGERLRMSAMWFGDDSAETDRVAQTREIPLFTVRSYLLCSRNLRIENGDIAGMFLAGNAEGSATR